MLTVTTKKDIVKQLSDKYDLTQLMTKLIVQDVFDSVVETLIAETRIELRNFGVFEIRRREARKARNPRTGDPVDVPAKNVVSFKPGKDMEERVRKLTHLPGQRRHKKTREDRHEAVGAGGGARGRGRR
jgi:integration host factor subunit beta